MANLITSLIEYELCIIKHIHEKYMKVLEMDSSLKGQYPIKGIDANLQCCLRGQVNEDWALTPTMFRDCYEDKFTKFRDEGKAMREQFAKISKSIEFKTDLDKLAYIQHYNSNTRLLDVTTDPYVGLFFACYDKQKQHNDKNGLVYIFDYVPFYSATELRVVINMKYIFEHGNGKLDVAGFVQKLNQEFSQNDYGYKIPLDKVDVLDALLSNPSYPDFIGVEPTLDFPRVKNQSGKFLLFQMRKSGGVLCNYYDDDNIEFYPIVIEAPEFVPSTFNSTAHVTSLFPYLWTSTCCLRIAASEKGKILNSLAALGYTEDYLLPG